ncbi:MAG: DUF4956 domain-containing protein [Thermoanaerobaculia bacterium]
MTSRTPGFFDSAATKVVLKVLVYYAVLIGFGVFALRELPRFPGLSTYVMEPMFGGVPAPAAAQGAPGALSTSPDHATLAVMVSMAMVAAILLSLPVAWVYQLTRAKRGYQQSVVQLLIILPLVVAGIVVLVKYSLALAFSLAGIVAAVRFRNTLDDSKDAVYVFLATGVGLAAAVDIQVATAISIVFNITVLGLWYTDFGHSATALEGRIAAQRLQRAKELARTGTFVAQIDSEVLRNMSKDQLEGVAERAWRRAHDDSSGDSKGSAGKEARLRVKTRDAEKMRGAFDPLLDDYVKEWRIGGVTINEDGVHTIDYFVELKKKTEPDELLSLVRTACGSDLVEATLN